MSVCVCVCERLPALERVVEHNGGRQLLLSLRERKRKKKRKKERESKREKERKKERERERKKK